MYQKNYKWTTKAAISIDFWGIKCTKPKSTYFPLYFWADPFVNLNVKFGWEKGIFEENVFSNICFTHKNAPKKYPTILKFEKKKSMTCPIKHGHYFDDIGLLECDSKSLFHLSLVVDDSFGFAE